jgi:hypothetical protein
MRHTRPAIWIQHVEQYLRPKLDGISDLTSALASLFTKTSQTWFYSWVNNLTKLGQMVSLENFITAFKEKYMDGAVGANVMNLDAGAGTRTVDMIDVTFDGDGNVGFLDITVTNTGSGNIIEIDIDGIHTGTAFLVSYGTDAATGDAVNLTMGTNVAGRAIVINSAATGVSGEGAGIDITHTGNLVAGADLFNITSSGDLSSTSNLLAIAF